MISRNNINTKAFQEEYCLIKEKKEKERKGKIL
jgi:hypothetical protein